MPADSYVIRFATDDEGRDVNHQVIISTEDAPYPPHRFAAMAVANMPDGTHQMVGIAISPDDSVDYAGYQDYLARGRPMVEMTADVLAPGHESIGLVWFARTRASEMTDEDAEHPNVIRGVVYRPATEEELRAWLPSDKEWSPEEVDVVY